MSSPYDGVPEGQWRGVTERLVQAHPLTHKIIHDAAMISWQRLWATRVGDAATGFALQGMNPTATLVGTFFEKLFAMELANQLPGQWRGGNGGGEKDLVCINDDSKSVEMKSSGQLGTKIFGNRSYGQAAENPDSSKKDKSGYYITINFFGQQITLLRFGWIDASDWKAQRSATGQMAGLPDNVYSSKLLDINGPYQLEAPIKLLKGVGPKAATELQAHGIRTIGDMVGRGAQDVPVKHAKHWHTAHTMYGKG